ncbi:UDP-3-O-(3-hydroxymyristoyl)glucosamine N-acyltransferase [Nibricoccus sp. IMCC34717]|uniref:UDP-3-O-(3-hydroxymyristoyl)glucosamine N-acyltransferase n=1 Tax=Nibricoccus sp. IMCC34717 TaxID=3034021 RepID=UPI00384E5FE4
MEVAFTLDDLCQWVSPKQVRGATTEVIRGIASLLHAKAGDLSFLGNPKYKAEVADSVASVILLPADFAGEPKAGQVFLLVDKPSWALAKVCARIEALIWPKPAAGIHPSAVVHPGASVDASATIGPLSVVEDGARVGPGAHLEAQVFIGRRAVVGEGCWLMPGAKVLAECELGKRVRLQAGVVIGSDGFGYEFVNGRHEKVPQVGNVVVGDDVEIGANSTIDRARFSRTVIGEGSKLDNLVQVAHNVVLGKHVILCAQVGVSGSTTVEDYVIVGGQAGLAGHLTVGKGSKVDGQTGVNSDLAPGSFVKGTPCLPYNLEQRINVLRQRLPDLFKRVDALEEKLR